MMHPVIFDTSQLFFLKGVRHAVFSPGSRNAPLSISFYRNKNIRKLTILDERSAGFIALGIAQQTKSPVVLCCTSGTALLNYGPAIAEAFYQEIPLIILSADRPPEWIDQWDGQTIRQQQVFSNHTKAFYQLPVDLDHPDAQWSYKVKIEAAINAATTGNCGPVHVNAPFREPFYPGKNQKLAFSKDLTTSQVIESGNPGPSSDLFLSVWARSKRKMIVMGHGMPSSDELKILDQISGEQNIPIINDVIANGQKIEDCIYHHDLFLSNHTTWEELRPDLIVTIGKSIISKNLKLFLRETKPIEWHLSSNAHPANPFQTEKYQLQGEVTLSLKQIIKSGSQDPAYKELWQNQSEKCALKLLELDRLPYSEFSAIKEVMIVLPDGIDLHLANSMPVRYANFIGLGQPNIRVYANRGTSGIDGTNGTTVGHALSTDRQVVLLSGDMSFLYDRNAFFHEYDLSNLRIIVFNNFGGGIFDLIPGPDLLDQDERESHFTTPHHKDLKLIADDIGFSYTKANDDITLELALSSFFDQSPKPKLLEIQTDPKTNKKIYFEIKRTING